MELRFIIDRSPEYDNVAGHLLLMLELLSRRERLPYIDLVWSNYKIFEDLSETADLDEPMAQQLKMQSYTSFMNLLDETYLEFTDTIGKAPSINDETRGVLLAGLKDVESIIYNTNSSSIPIPLNESQRALLRMAGTMLESENRIEETDREKILSSIDDLRKMLEQSDLKPAARTALLEIIRLTRNALDYYGIHGSRGFKKAFKAMLGELMFVYMEEGEEVAKEPWWSKSFAHVKKVGEVLKLASGASWAIESVSSIFIESE